MSSEPEMLNLYKIQMPNIEAEQRSFEARTLTLLLKRILCQVLSILSEMNNVLLICKYIKHVSTDKNRYRLCIIMFYQYFT